MHESQVNLISLCCIKQIITINQHTISLVTNLIRNLECVRLIVVRNKKCEKVSLRRESLLPRFLEYFRAHSFYSFSRIQSIENAINALLCALACYLVAITIICAREQASSLFCECFANRLLNKSRPALFCLENPEGKTKTRSKKTSLLPLTTQTKDLNLPRTLFLVQALLYHCGSRR